jgi:hypothetical protein
MATTKDIKLNNTPEEQKPTTTAPAAQQTTAATPTDNGNAESTAATQPTTAAPAATATTTTQPGGATPATEKVSTPPSQPTQTAAPAEGTTSAPTGAPQPEAKKRMTYAQMFEQWHKEDHPQTAEEKEAERKRQRRKAIFAAIGDGVSALANLYYTSKGALNAYDGKNTMSGKLKEQWEKDRKERKAKDKEYLTGYMQAQKWDADYERALAQAAEKKRRADAKEGREVEAHGMKKEEHDWEEKLQPEKERKAKADADAAEHKATTAKAEADNASEYYSGRNKKLTADTNKANRTNTGGGSRGGTKKRYPVFNDKQEVVEYRDNEPEAINETNRLGGTYPDKITVTERTEDDGYGGQKKVTTKTTKLSTVKKKPYSGFSIHK